MRNPLVALVGATFVLGLMAAPAGAATEFGSNCTAREGEPGLTFIDVAHSSAEPLPAAAPISGVITQGKVSFDVEKATPGGTATLQVYRPAGPNQFTLIAQSSPAPISQGSNLFATRVPVLAGDHLGLVSQGTGESGGLFCDTGDAGDQMAYTSEPPPLGGTQTFNTAPSYRAPLAAVIEPDADNDGYGDETQDACPQSAAFQTPCPVIALDSSAKAGKKAVTILVAASSEGTVGVKGIAKLGKGKKATLKAKAKTVSAGSVASFKLKFNAKLIKRLKELQPSRKLTLKVTATATNVAGQVSTDKLKVKLKGQGTT